MADSRAVRETIYNNPSRELAAPPFDRRKSGRMNAAGIAVLYACAEMQTTVAEIRVPVGGRAVVGTFRFLREARLLDFRQVEKARVPRNTSWFLDEFPRLNGHVSFLRRLHEILRQPVLPNTEDLEYLPTQVIAEYLAMRVDPPLDGVILHSSLTQPGTGTNVILFARASVVEGDDGEAIRVAKIVIDSSPAEPDEDDGFGFLSEEDVTEKRLPESHVISAATRAEAMLALVGDLQIVHVRNILLDTAARRISFRAYRERTEEEYPFSHLETPNCGSALMIVRFETMMLGLVIV